MTSQIKETFGEFIRSHRNEKGWTLTILAAKLGMDSANLSKVETGQREFDHKRLEKLADAFDIDLESLKEEYFSDQIAKTIYTTNTSPKVLRLAEEKVKYLVQKNSKQGNFKF